MKKSPSTYDMSALKHALIAATGPGKAWSRRSLSLATGMGPDVVRNILSGKSRQPEMDTVVALAKALDRPFADFVSDESSWGFYGSSFALPILGKVEAGVWREAEVVDEQPNSVPLLPIRHIAGAKRFLLEVSGYSMDELFQPGEYLDCLDVHAKRIIPKAGDIVVVDRVQGALHETTVKELMQNSSGHWELRPRSTRPEFQTTIAIDRPMPDYDNENEVRVVAIVIGSYRKAPGRSFD